MSTPNTQFRFFSDWSKDCIDTQTETIQSWVQKLGIWDWELRFISSELFSIRFMF